MNDRQISALLDALEQPTKRIRRAIGVIRELQRDHDEYQARAQSLEVTVAALRADNRWLRKEQGPTELDPRDARIVQLQTEVKRLQRLLDDMHAANASPSCVRAEQERLQHERDEYAREQVEEAVLKTLRQE